MKTFYAMKSEKCWIKSDSHWFDVIASNGNVITRRAMTAPVALRYFRRYGVEFRTAAQMWPIIAGRVAA